MIRWIKKFIKYMINSHPGTVNNLIRMLKNAKIIEDYNLQHLLWVSNLYLRVKSIPGHIAEVGVADGRNTILFGRLIKMHNDQAIRQYIGFDTFNGYTNKNLERDKHLRKNEYKNISKDTVIKKCQDEDIEELVELFEGDALESVPKILSSHQGKKFHSGKAKFALVYIDCNSYTPAVKSMENFLPYMMPGGYIVIDEKLQGSETEAILEFAKKNSLRVQKFGTNEVPMGIQIPFYDE